MDNIFTVTRKITFAYSCESFPISMQLLHRYNPVDYDGFSIVSISKCPQTSIFRVVKGVSLS